MIREDTVDGKPAIIAFFNDEFETCEEEDATIAKIIFEDGSNMFVLIGDLEERLGEGSEEAPAEPEPELEV